MATTILDKVSKVFSNEKFPIPYGFSKEDVVPDAPRLFSDEFWLFYLHEMTVYGLTAYSLGLTTTQRQDIRHFYFESYKEAFELYNQTFELMRSKGLLEREPSIVVPEHADFAKKQSFMAGWFGDHRPLNAIEIKSLFFNLNKSVLAKTLTLGFHQVVQSDEVRSFLKRTVSLAQKNISVFASILEKDFIRSTVSWDSHVTDSQITPFSEKLIMVHSSFLIEAAMSYYGTAMASSMRKDLGLHYSAAIADCTKLAEDGMNIMIAKGWFEQPPQAVDRLGLQ
jgi:hypothetical protein